MTNTCFKGSCLCGSVEYEINGEALALYHCHCRRCRKTYGTGHASNIRIAASNVNWVKGKELIKTYKLPEAERFKNDFCSQCGSPLPRLFPEHGFIVLPAGTLDTELPQLNACRIFYSDKSPWSCEDGLPTFDGYPD